MFPEGGEAEYRAPRHAYESEEDESEDLLQYEAQAVHITCESSPIPKLELRGRPVLVLLGSIGAAMLAAWQGEQSKWVVTCTYNVDGFPTAYVSAARESLGTTLLLIPDPDTMRADQCAPLVRQVFGDLNPRSLAVITTYSPYQYISLSAHERQDLIRYLCYTPHNTSLPAIPAFKVSSMPSFAPWKTPNTITGLAAALLAGCKTRSVPGILHFAPSLGAQRSLVGWTPARRVLPYEVQQMTEAEAMRQLRSHARDVDEELIKTLSKLMPISQAAAIHLPNSCHATETLCQVAARYISSLPSQRQTGDVGDGGMYL